MNYKDAEKIAKIPYGRMPIPSGTDIDNTDQWLKDLAESFTRRGFSVAQVDQIFHVWDETGEIDINLPLNTLSQALTNGAYFKGIRFGIEIDKSIFTNLVPEGVPNSTIIDNMDPENPIISQKTFAQWVEGFGYKTKLDNTSVLFKATLNGKLFTSDDLIPLFGLVGNGLSIYFWREFVELYNGELYNESEE